MRGDAKALTAESADLLYHLMVVWAQADLEPHQVWDELARRYGRGGAS